MSEDHSARRRIGIKVTYDGIKIEQDRGLVLAPANEAADLEIELSGSAGNHAIRLNFSDPAEWSEITKGGQE